MGSCRSEAMGPPSLQTKLLSHLESRVESRSMSGNEKSGLEVKFSLEKKKKNHRNKKNVFAQASTLLEATTSIFMLKKWLTITFSTADYGSLIFC